MRINRVCKYVIYSIKYIFITVFETHTKLTAHRVEIVWNVRHHCVYKKRSLDRLYWVVKNSGLRRRDKRERANECGGGLGVEVSQIRLNLGTKKSGNIYYRHNGKGCRQLIFRRGLVALHGCRTAYPSVGRFGYRVYYGNDRPARTEERSWYFCLTC